VSAPQPSRVDPGLDEKGSKSKLGSAVKAGGKLGGALTASGLAEVIQEARLAWSDAQACSVVLDLEVFLEGFKHDRELLQNLSAKIQRAIARKSGVDAKLLRGIARRVKRVLRSLWSFEPRVKYLAFLTPGEIDALTRASSKLYAVLERYWSVLRELVERGELDKPLARLVEEYLNRVLEPLEPSAEHVSLLAERGVKAFVKAIRDAKLSLSLLGIAAGVEIPDPETLRVADALDLIAKLYKAMLDYILEGVEFEEVHAPCPGVAFVARKGADPLLKSLGLSIAASIKLLGDLGVYGDWRVRGVLIAASSVLVAETGWGDRVVALKWPSGKLDFYFLLTGDSSACSCAGVNYFTATLNYYGYTIGVRECSPGDLEKLRAYTPLSFSSCYAVSFEDWREAGRFAATVIPVSLAPKLSLDQLYEVHSRAARKTPLIKPFYKLLEEAEEIAGKTGMPLQLVAPVHVLSHICETFTASMQAALEW